MFYDKQEHDDVALNKWADEKRELESELQEIERRMDRASDLCYHYSEESSLIRCNKRIAQIDKLIPWRMKRLGLP